MPKKYAKGFMRKIPKGKGIKNVEKRFMQKYGIHSSDDVRVYRRGGKVKKEVWLYGRGWVSEPAFKRYYNASMLGLFE